MEVMTEPSAEVKMWGSRRRFFLLLLLLLLTTSDVVLDTDISRVEEQVKDMGTTVMHNKSLHAPEDGPFISKSWDARSKGPSRISWVTLLVESTWPDPSACRGS